MADISIIGSGNMGKAIARIAAKGGHTVETFNQSSGDGPVTGDIVVLAVPYSAVGEIIAQRGAELADKIVVDLTNPLDFDTFDSLVVPADASAAAEIATALPHSSVLKAFNTTFAGVLNAGTIGELPVTVLVAGDDADAKAQLAEIITAGGLRALDVGSLKRARELESLGFLQVTLAASEKISWTGGLGLVD